MNGLNYTNAKDDFLVFHLKKGDERAFKMLYFRYGSPIYGFSLSMVKSTDSAEEIVQDVFLKVWDNRKELDVDRNFKSFIFTIAKNLSLNVLSKAANDIKFRNQILQTGVRSSTTTRNQILNKEYDLIKGNAINSLSKRRKEIFLMSREQGLSYQEISNKLGISVNTVKTQMKEALRNLREYLVKHGNIEFLILSLILTKYN